MTSKGQRAKGTARGGARKGAGRPALFAGRKKITFSMVFTSDARDMAAALKIQSGLSLSGILEHLSRTSDGEWPARGPDPFPGKVHQAFRVLLTREAAAILRRGMRSSGHSAGVLGEALIRGAGPDTAFPALPRPSTGAPQGKRAAGLPSHRPKSESPHGGPTRSQV